MTFSAHNRAAFITRALAVRIVAAPMAAAPIALIIGTAALLFFFPPTQHSFYPQCPIYALFHLQCPGCGTTRAFAALLHGHVREALHLNALTTLLLPIPIAYATQIYRNYLHRKPIRWPQPSRATIYALLCITIVFTIARNR